MAAAPAHVTQCPTSFSGVSRVGGALARTANKRPARHRLCVGGGGGCNDIARIRRRSPPEQSRGGGGEGKPRGTAGDCAGPAPRSLAASAGARPSPATRLHGVLARVPEREGGGEAVAVRAEVSARGRARGGRGVYKGRARGGGAQSGQRFVAEPVTPTAATSRPSGSPFLEAERDEPETDLSL